MEANQAISAAEVKRMMKLQDVILKAMAKKISWLAAAEIAGMSDRTMRRMRQRYQEFGYTGLFDQRRGRRSIHRIPMQTAERVLGLYRDRYFDLSVRHFHEKLAEEHELEISYSWVKQALQGAGLVARGRKRACEDRRLREDLDKGTLRGQFVIAYRRAGVIQWPNSIHRFGRRDAIEDTSTLNRRQPGLRESRYRANAGML